MKKINFRKCFPLLIIGFFIAAYFPLHAQNKIDHLNAYFSAKAAQHEFNGVILVAEGDEIVYQHAFGYADFENRRLNNIHSRFPIASITKLLTATAILQLQDKGELNINLPVKHYLSAFPYPQITIRQLLTHTTGILSWDSVFGPLADKYPDSMFTNDRVIPQYARANAKLEFEPGTVHSYNNINSVFAALVIEKVSGMHYEGYMQKYIFKPAGMTETFIPKITFLNYNTAEQNNLSRLYVTHYFNNIRECADTMKQVKQYWRRYNFRGFGEIVTTANDLFLFNEALLSGKLLKPSTLKLAQTPIRLKGGEQTRMGLGWQVEEDSVLGKIAGHGGGITGLSTGFLYQFNHQRLAVVLDNTQQNAEDMEVDALMIMAGRKLKIPGKSIARVFGYTLVKYGINAAKDSLAVLKKNPAYELSEDQMNSLGYDLLRSGKIAQAIETFKTNTELYPQSYNTFDSYGEALLQDGQKQKAISMYKKSVELNPHNENGKQIIKQLTE